MDNIEFDNWVEQSEAIIGKNKTELVKCPKCKSTGGLCTHEGWDLNFPDECPTEEGDCMFCDSGKECPICKGEGFVNSPIPPNRKQLGILGGSL